MRIVQHLCDVARRRAIDAAIVEGYERVPDAPAGPWLDAATRALIVAEPW